jgi:hypothetical protein
VGWRALSLMLVLALAACVPSPRSRPASHRPAPPPRHAATQSPPQVDIRQCLADLSRSGAEFTPLPDKYLPGGCSAVGTVKLTAVGVPVTNLGAMTCRLATRFSEWTHDAVQEAARAWLDSPVVKIETFGTFNCRPIDGIAGKKLSQHAFANAVDVAAFDLADGKRITVKDGWRGPDENVRNFLRAAFKAGCRRFAVSLSPESDSFHQNHLHFDMGPNGPYCH